MRATAKGTFELVLLLRERSSRRWCEDMGAGPDVAEGWDRVHKRDLAALEEHKLTPLDDGDRVVFPEPLPPPEPEPIKRSLGSAGRTPFRLGLDEHLAAVTGDEQPDVTEPPTVEDATAMALAFGPQTLPEVHARVLVMRPGTSKGAVGDALRRLEDTWRAVKSGNPKNYVYQTASHCAGESP
jgi:hypothetical protein